MVRNVVVTTARTTTKAAAARAMVAGAMRTTATLMAMTATAATAATMMPNGDKDNEDGICRRQQRRDIRATLLAVVLCVRSLHLWRERVL